MPICCAYSLVLKPIDHSSPHFLQPSLAKCQFGVFPAAVPLRSQQAQEFSKPPSRTAHAHPTILQASPSCPLSLAHPCSRTTVSVVLLMRSCPYGPLSCSPHARGLASLGPPQLQSSLSCVLHMPSECSSIGRVIHCSGLLKQGCRRCSWPHTSTGVHMCP